MDVSFSPRVKFEVQNDSYASEFMNHFANPKKNIEFMDSTLQNIDEEDIIFAVVEESI